MKFLCAVAILVSSTSAMANGPLLLPSPGMASAPVAMYAPEVQPVPDSEMFSPPPVHTLKMHHNVKYVQTRKAHPCAEPLVVAVPDPCDPCGQACVGVQICVPPCDCPVIKVRRNGNKVKYDYGKYAVNITVRRSGLIVVNYDW